MQVISPEILNLGTLFTIIAMLIIGGLGNFYGPIIGAFFLTFLSEYTRDIGPSRFLIVGLAVVIILIIMPKGLVAIGESIKSRITRRVS